MLEKRITKKTSRHVHTFYGGGVGQVELRGRCVGVCRGVDIGVELLDLAQVASPHVGSGAPTPHTEHDVWVT